MRSRRRLAGSRFGGASSGREAWATVSVTSGLLPFGDKSYLRGFEKFRKGEGKCAQCANRAREAMGALLRP